MRIPHRLAGAVALLCLFTAVAPAAAPVRITSMNIANLGDTKERKRSLVDIANALIATNPDIIAVQEVEPNELGDTQVGALADLLNIAADYFNTARYSYDVFTTDIGDENFAFLWRSPAALAGDVYIFPYEDDPDELPTFIRPPVIATFDVGDTEIDVINCHLYTKVHGTSAQGRAAELEAIAAYLKENADQNIVVVGDFNRFLNGKSPWKKIATNGHTSDYRFALLEAIPGLDEVRDEAPEDIYSTTAVAKRSIYDQIIVTRGLFDEFGTATFNQNVGINPFDTAATYQWFGDDWYTVKDIISDHRPVWIELQLPD